MSSCGSAGVPAILALLYDLEQMRVKSVFEVPAEQQQSRIYRPASRGPEKRIDCEKVLLWNVLYFLESADPVLGADASQASRRTRSPTIPHKLAISQRQQGSV
jgi:hypothetical protein